MAFWASAIADSEIGPFSNTSLQERYTLDFTAPAQGDYLILISFAKQDVTTPNVNLEWRVQLDDTITICEGLEATKSTDRTVEYNTVASVYLAENLASGSHYVDIDVASPSADNYYMRYAKIIVIRLDDWLPTTGMFDYVATEGETSFNQAAWSTVQTLTFTPDTAGDYLILASCELDVNDTNDSASLRLNYDSASEYLPVVNAEETADASYATSEAKKTTEYVSWAWGGIVSIPASEKTITLEAKTSPSTTSYIRKRRIIAIRIAAMDSSAITDEDPANASTSSQWSDKSVISFTPASTEDYLILSGILQKPDNVNAAGHTRLEQTVGTGTGTISLQNFDAQDSTGFADCNPLFTAHIKSLANTLQTFKTQYGYAEASGTTYSKGSFIVAIRKPSAATTAYKDITFKSSLLSADTFKDIAYKTDLLSEDRFKDIAYKTSLVSEDRFKDIAYKTDLLSADAYKDIAYKTDLWSADTFKDIAYKTDLWGVGFKDIAFKTSLTAIVDYKDLAYKTDLLSADTFKDITYKTDLLSADTFKDIAYKTSLLSEDLFKDIVYKTDLLSADTFKDIAYKTDLWSADAYKDIAYKTDLWGVGFKDIAFKTSLQGFFYKDLAYKTDLLSADTYKDLAYKTSLVSEDLFKDISFKTDLWGVGFKDVTYKTDLLSADSYKDIAYKTDLWGVGFKDIGFKTDLWGVGFKDISFITSLTAFAFTTDYKDIAFKSSLVYPPILELIDCTATFSKEPNINPTYEKSNNIKAAHEISDKITATFSKVGIRRYVE